MKRKSLFLILFLAILSFTGCSSDGDIEKEEETIYITSIEDLVKIKDEVNAGDDKELTTYILSNDINLGGSSDNQWEGIGTSLYPFLGKFDGKGHTISGLYFDDEWGVDKGLFGFVGMGAEIVDLTVDGYFNGNYHIGALAGSVFNATITNCHSKASVFANSYLGGLIGNITYEAYIDGCSNSGTVTGVKEYIGGVIGYSGYYCTITDCYNEGDVSCGGAIYGVSYNDCVGGVVGVNHTGIVKNCNNIGNVASGRKNTGGIVGENNGGTVVNCYNENYITCSENYLGGIVGFNTEYSTVANCYNTGDVLSDSRYVGGIVGYTDGKVLNNYNLGEISGTNSYVAGIAGSFGNTSFVVLESNFYLEGSVLGNNTYAGDGVEMTDTDMQSASFVTTLNDYASNYNTQNTDATELCAWESDNVNVYPILNFDDLP